MQNLIIVNTGNMNKELGLNVELSNLTKQDVFIGPVINWPGKRSLL